jgi:tryptophan halogenase
MINNITIVGGGTAGWLAAFILSKVYKLKVTVIESSKIGIIGVGEGGTHVLGSLLNTVNTFGFSPREFMLATDATPKLGVHHLGWTKKHNGYILPLDLLPNSESEDFLPLALERNISIHAITELGILIKNNIVPIASDESGIWDTANFSYHFDGTKVGMYFKKKCADVVDVIDTVVTEVLLDESGRIDKLRLENGHFNKSDLYIDCTGFQRLLMNALGTKWISYSKNLLMNTAIPFRMKHYNILPMTTAHALSSGWTWSIPTTVNQGMGYVYNDQFISYSDAVLELEKEYGKYGDINIVKTIKFDPGRLEKVWNKNVVALGLASAFVEPLEATSIHATAIQIEELGEYLSNDNGNSEDYNRHMTALYDDIKDFIVLHYLGNKENSEFWNYCKKTDIATDRVKEILEISKTRMLTEKDVPNPFNSLSYRAWNHVLAGLGKFDNIKSQVDSNTESRYNKWLHDVLLKAKSYKTLQEVIDHSGNHWLL